MNINQQTLAPHFTDKQIQNAVEAELDWTPGIHAPAIGVSVTNGVVALSGEVRTYGQKLAAKNAALRTCGVTAVADDILIQAVANVRHTDTDLAKAAHNILTNNAFVEPANIKVEVSNQIVTLTGTVDWNYQREAARRSLEFLDGVRGIDNRITLTERMPAVDTAKRIRDAFARNAHLEHADLHVSVNGTVVTLSGRVYSWSDKVRAGITAWSSPNVSEVRNDISVLDV